MTTRCSLCLLLPEWCCCEAIPSVENQLPVIIVRHWRERTRKSNSARLAQAALVRCETLDYGVRDQPFDPTPLQEPGSWLLFPPPMDHYCRVIEDSSVTILGRDPLPLVRQLVVIDGSWNQARRMSHRIPALAEMPRMALPLPEEVPSRLRKAPGPEFQATLEAIAGALGHLEGEHVAAPLQGLFEVFVARGRAQGRKVERVHQRQTPAAAWI